MSIAVTVVIILLYLILLFGISGIAMKNAAKKKSSGEEVGKNNFLMAGKSLPTYLVAFMMAGAGIGSINTTGVAEQVQTAGLSGMCVGFAGAIALIVLALFGAKRMRALPYNTMPSMAKAYCGELTRWLLGLGGLIIAMAIAALQFVGGGAMLASMFPSAISYTQGVIITAVIFLGLAVIGGMLGSSLVNVINMIVMYIGLGLVLIVSLGKVGGFSGLAEKVNAIPEPTKSGAPWLSLTGGLGLATFISYFATEIPNRFTTQSNTQQIFAARDGKAARNGLIIGALMMIPITLISATLGLVARVQFPDLEVKTQALSKIVLTTGPVLSGLGLAALWAVNISTGVALMMTCSQLISIDILSPFNRKRAMTEKQQSVQARVVLVAVTVIALVMAFYMRGIVSTIMTMCCITAAFAFIFVPILYCPKALKKSTGPALLIVSYVFFFLWLVIPGLKSAFPDPVYPEWGLALITFFICFFADKRSIDIPEG